MTDSDRVASQLQALLATRQTEADPSWVDIIGIGSLVGIVSARCTSPNAREFKQCTVRNFRRVFAHPSSPNLRRGWPFADHETREYAGLSVEAAEGSEFNAAAFQVPMDELGNVVGREGMYDLTWAEFIDSNGESHQGLICAKFYNDAAYKQMLGSDELFHEKYGQFGIEHVWDRELVGSIWPSRPYLRHVVLAMQNMGGQVAIALTTMLN